MIAFAERLHGDVIVWWDIHGLDGTATDAESELEAAGRAAVWEGVVCSWMLVETWFGVESPAGLAEHMSAGEENAGFILVGLGGRRGRRRVVRGWGMVRGGRSEADDVEFLVVTDGADDETIRIGSIGVEDVLLDFVPKGVVLRGATVRHCR